jgi:hypothetical protein
VEEERQQRTFNSDDENDFIVEEKTNKALKRARANQSYAEEEEVYTPHRPAKNQTFAMIQPKMEVKTETNQG